jgi:hypothetical protein
MSHFTGGWPVREKSANGVPAPKTSIERYCVRCRASFLGLAAGKTGEVGIWVEWNWFCSRECFERPKTWPL